MGTRVEKIALNEEQTKRFLSFFIKEAIELAEKEILEQQMKDGDS